MFCKNCGSNLKDGSTFCHNCGSPVNDYIVHNPQVTAMPAPAEQNVQNIPNVPPIYNAPVNPPMYQGVPVQNMPVQNVPVQNVPVQNIPVQNVPVQNMPVQYPQNPQMYGYAPYPIYEAPKKSGGAFSVLALIFGIIGASMDALGILFAPAALIFGIIARKKSKSGMALAGIILGSIGTAFSIIAILSLIFNGESLLDSFLYDGGLYF